MATTAKIGTTFTAVAKESEALRLALEKAKTLAAAQTAQTEGSTYNPAVPMATSVVNKVAPINTYSSPEDSAGMVSYQADPRVATTNDALANSYAGLDYGHHGNRKWYRKYRSWADYWRTTTEGALFGLKGGAPTDELSQLQQQLFAQYQADKLKNPEAFNPNYNFTNLIGARQKGLTQALNQRAAALGIGDVFQGSMDIATRSRETLANQAMATYRPTAWAENQKLQNTQDAMITQMALADIEARKSVAGAGRNAG